jgi:hypothetical protein
MDYGFQHHGLFKISKYFDHSNKGVVVNKGESIKLKDKSNFLDTLSPTTLFQEYQNSRQRFDIL